MFVIDGRAIAKKIREDLKHKIAASGLAPGLAAILVGNDPASKLYVSLKEKACAEVGIRFEKHLFGESSKEDQIIQKIKEINGNPKFHGILVQLPLPTGLNVHKILKTIEPNKDADGFISKINPVLPRAIWTLIEEGLKLKNHHAVGQKTLVIGNSAEFIKTTADFLDAKRLNCKTQTYDQICQDKKQIKHFDIVVIAVGEPKFLNGADFKDDAIVIDIGTNRLPDGRIVGDVDYESTKDKDIWITPVPGGVGPVTVATLLENIFLLAQKICPVIQPRKVALGDQKETTD